MENVSVSDNFVLLGLREMENFKYILSVFFLGIYLMIVLISSMIIFITIKHVTLHEPMYIFICNLVLNNILESSSLFPKLVIDLLSGCSTVSFSGCATQGFFIQNFVAIEVLTFTAMAFDRYLAVSDPLRYHTLMTNGKALQYIFVFWFVIFIVGIAGHVLTMRTTVCGSNIQNAFCETMSIYHLACGSTVANDIFGSTWSSLFIIGSLSVVIYCYIRTFHICLKNSTKSTQKAIHTLVTHIIAFSTSIGTGLFVVFRYRIKGFTHTTTTHTVIALTSLSVSVTLSPLIYGLRTEALRTRIVHRLKKMNTFLHSDNLK